MCKDIKIAEKYINLYKSAKSRTIEFTLTISDVRNLLKTKKCYYTGAILNDIQNDPNCRSIDRVDNDLGYVSGNVVACTRNINILKSNMTTKEIKSIYNGLKRKKVI